MKLSETLIVAEILAGIKINRIEDKGAKDALLKDYLAIRRAAKGAGESRDEIVRKFQEDWADELKAVRSFREKGKPVIGHLDFLEAERDANRAISDTLGAQVEVDIIPVKIEAVEAVSEDITLEQIAFLVDMGVMEE